MATTNGNGTKSKAIQQSLALYNQLEVTLRQAAKEQHPMTLRDIYEVPAIKELAKNEVQVRDKLKTLAEKQLLTRSTVAQSQSGDRRNRVGYMWRDEEKKADFPTLEREATKEAVKPPVKKVTPKPVAVPATPPAPVPDKPKEVEIVIHGMLVVVGYNPLTNRPRIIIE